MLASPMAQYRIIVEGMVDPLWLACLGGMAITEQRESGQRESGQRESGQSVITQLEGQLADQSALQGVIDMLFMLGLRLMLVERQAMQEKK